MNAREGAVIDTHVLLWMFDGSLPTRTSSPWRPSPSPERL